ncbi:dienelactone hydrolase family protein [Martelella soudanensis]|uniref:dienelactone hydrolase family protein n=1 Tax=unclassified Martelella TaxID=2629616 RepID=UPI0015DDCD8C|nr:MULTISPECIES: dienelactone hydrolase family protein [unclassified Martelella]
MIERDCVYGGGEETVTGWLCAPEPASRKRHPGVLVVHGAHGLDDHVVSSSRRIAALGYAVFAVDLWGERKQPKGPDEFGPLLGRYAGDRDYWFSRIDAACAALAGQPETDATRIGAAGYCFGGASVLEYVRMGGRIAAGVSLHGGLDMVADDWSRAVAGTGILIATGADDPLAKSEDRMRIENAMSAAGIVWETDLYGGVRHAFSEPDTPATPPFAAYDAHADRRSFQAMTAFFAAML